MTTTLPQSYRDPIIQKYVDYIKSNMDVFKTFYFGEPIKIPASNLPCLIISKTATDATESDVANDEHNIQLTFTVVTDIRNDIIDDKTLVAGTNTLYYILEGRDTDTLALNPDSLLNLLRHSVDLNQGKFLYTDVGTKTKVSYAMTIGKRDAGAYAIEGSITIVAKFIQLR